MKDIGRGALYFSNTHVQKEQRWYVSMPIHEFKSVFNMLKSRESIILHAMSLLISYICYVLIMHRIPLTQLHTHDTYAYVKTEGCWKS